MCRVSATGCVFFLLAQKRQAATSESLCVCVPGTFLQQGKCEVCLEGSVCFGSQMVLQEGAGAEKTFHAVGLFFFCFPVLDSPEFFGEGGGDLFHCLFLFLFFLRGVGGAGGRELC